MPSKISSAEFEIVINRKVYYVSWNEGSFCLIGRPMTEGWMYEKDWEAAPTIENADAYVRRALGENEPG